MSTIDEGSSVFEKYKKSISALSKVFNLEDDYSLAHSTNIDDHGSLEILQSIIKCLITSKACDTDEFINYLEKEIKDRIKTPSKKKKIWENLKDIIMLPQLSENDMLTITPGILKTFGDEVLREFKKQEIERNPINVPKEQVLVNVKK